MSEAANSHLDPNLSASSAPSSSAETASHPLAAAPVTVDAVEDEWQTVDLPGAISVEAILAGKVSLAEIPATPELAEADHSPAAIAQLDQENAALREQLQQLEQDLTQAQIELQLEIARSLYAPSAAVTIAPEANPSTTELPDAAALPQLGQLAQELELAQQAAQRQQILVETLTNQLHSSQERIAQLERECALTQQRYNEQMQQLLQSENTCRDLRMRLMRQQQHTLQFKAALEKCLDMPAALQQHPFVQNLALDDQTDSSLDMSAANPFGHAPFVPKAHPVKPWSTEGEATEGFYTTAGSDLSGLPNLLSRLRSTDDLENESGQVSHNFELTSTSLTPVAAEFGMAALPADAPQQIGELLNLMFPEAVEPPVEVIAAVPPAPEAIFDLNPFMEAGEVMATESEPPIVTEMLPPVAMPQPSGINMWDDLAQLIDPVTATEPTAVTPITTDSPSSTAVAELRAANSLNLPSESIAASEPDSEPTAIPDQRPTNRPILLAFPSVNAAAAVNAATELSPEPDSIAAHPSATWTAYQLDESSQLDAIDSAPVSFDAASAIPANWPSPVLYPLRPTKRLKSLAAVELPTFRRG